MNIEKGGTVMVCTENVRPLMEPETENGQILHAHTHKIRRT